jgi:hypothetical protein
MLYTLRDKLFASLETPLPRGAQGGDLSDFSIYESIFTVFEDAYTRIKSIPDGMLLIEITLLRAVKRGSLTPTLSSKGREEKPIQQGIGKKPSESSIQKEEPKITQPMQEPPIDIKPTTSNIKTPPKEEIRSVKDEDASAPLSSGRGAGGEEFSYATLLRFLKEKKPALMLDLKTARYEVQGTTLVLTFSKEWNYSRVNAASVKNTIAEILESAFSGKWNVDCRLEFTKNGDISDGVF